MNLWLNLGDLGESPNKPVLTFAFVFSQTKRSRLLTLKSGILLFLKYSSGLPCHPD
jgi:hypothetical protein